MQSFGQSAGVLPPGQIRAAPEHGVDVQTRQPGGLGLLAEAIQRRARGFDRAEVLQEQAHLVDGEVGLAVNLPIARVLEIPRDDEVGDLVPGGRGDLAGVEQLDLVRRVVALDVEPVVIGPHQAELDAAVVRGLQKAPLQRALQVGAVVVVIPVEDEGIDAVVGGGVNLLGHDLGIGFVGVAPKRDLGLLMAREARLGLPDEVPLGEPGILGLVPPRVGMLAGIVIGGDGDFRSGGSRMAKSEPPPGSIMRHPKEGTLRHCSHNPAVSMASS